MWRLRALTAFVIAERVFVVAVAGHAAFPPPTRPTVLANADRQATTQTRDRPQAKTRRTRPRANHKPNLRAHLKIIPLTPSKRLAPPQKRLEPAKRAARETSYLTHPGFALALIYEG